MKYSARTLIRPSGKPHKEDVCEVCGKLSISFKMREDKKKVCIACFFEDKEHETTDDIRA